MTTDDIPRLEGGGREFLDKIQNKLHDDIAAAIEKGDLTGVNAWANMVAFTVANTLISCAKEGKEEHAMAIVNMAAKHGFEEARE